MDKANHRLVDLFKKYMEGTISDAEQTELNQELASSTSKRELFNQLTNGNWLIQQMSELYNVDPQKEWEKLSPRLVEDEIPAPVHDHTLDHKEVKRKRWFTTFAIAAVSLAVIVTAYLMLKQPPEKGRADQDLVTNSKNGSYESKKIDLVVNSKDVNHARASDNNPLPEDHITIKTGHADKRMVKLPDGSHVWLNGGSSISYLKSFRERKVIMSGEAYFEIVKNKKKPFYVSLPKDYTIKVTGTSFNVNNSQDTGITKITLLEGSIHVGRDDVSSYLPLNPRQQMQIYPDGHTSIVNTSKPEDELAWKNEKFKFDDTDLKSILMQVENWYDVELVFDPAAPNPKLWGGISRGKPMHEVLDFLREISGVKIELKEKEKKIIVPAP